jgi:hypothetical protein
MYDTCKPFALFIVNKYDYFAGPTSANKADTAMLRTALLLVLCAKIKLLKWQFIQGDYNI